eukprot:12144085-Heterocapsa_arctica.AAC.1
MGMDPTREANVAVGEQREQNQVPMVPAAQGQGAPGQAQEQELLPGSVEAAQHQAVIAAQALAAGRAIHG